MIVIYFVEVKRKRKSTRKKVEEKKEKSDKREFQQKRFEIMYQKSPD